jgi:type 1 glutamine amidotransferase
MAGKNVLVFTKSSGYQHSVITRQGDEPAHAERILVELGRRLGCEVTCSKDGTLFEPDRIGRWDAFVFYTSGDLTKDSRDGAPNMTAAGKQALLDAVAGGKGFVGCHCAADTFHSVEVDGKQVIDPYIRMIGGEFEWHGKQQAARNRMVDPGFAGMGVTDFQMHEEWYLCKNFAGDLHVIGLQVTEGMEEERYRKWAVYPQTWARMHGRGRVYYTGLAHREDVWEGELFGKLVGAGLRWVTGQAEADVRPNVRQVAPDVPTL